jgi:DNA-binding transcriptional LysR family regulator
MRLDSFDLNLLVAFDTLLSEGSVTRAAERLNVTQSAMSASLKRLRHAFQDELLVLQGKKMVPTPLALTLAPEISDALTMLRSLISSGARFDPATSERSFRIAASDYITTVLLAPLIRMLEINAPSIRIDMTLPSEASSERLANADYDLLITPEEFTDPNHPTELLLEERHVIVGAADNPIFARPITLESFAETGLVVVRIDGRNTFVENALDRIGVARKIEVHAPSFIQVPWLLAGTRRIALMHERLARLMAPGLKLRIAEAPFEVPPMREMIQYHATRERDEGLSWLRSKLKEFARDA